MRRNWRVSVSCSQARREIQARRESVANNPDSVRVRWSRRSLSGAAEFGWRAGERVIDVCRREGRVLITLDLDFSNILSYPPSDFAGIVVLRLVARPGPYDGDERDRARAGFDSCRTGRGNSLDCRRASNSHSRVKIPSAGDPSVG